MVGFNDMPIHQGLFYAQRFEDCVLSKFVSKFTFSYLLRDILRFRFDDMQNIVARNIGDPSG